MAACGLLLAACTVGKRPQARPQQTAGPQTPRAPTPVAMETAQALGLWHSDFGAVKIETDADRSPDAVMGVWVYERNGQEVVGFFSGSLRGNVLDFTWHDPAEPADLTGGGYVVFEPAGGSFSGQLWTTDRQRTYVWNGWRTQGAQPASAAPTDPYGSTAPSTSPEASGELLGNPYGGSSYGGQASPPPARTEPPPPPRDPSTPGNPYD